MLFYCLLPTAYCLPALGSSWACAMCRDAVAGFMNGMAQGYFWSIVLMLSMPFVLIGVLTWCVVRAYRLPAAPPNGKSGAAQAGRRGAS